MRYRAHDLLWLDGPDAFTPASEAPAWLDAAWLARSPVVVRREVVAPGRVPVGVRGLERHQRCAGYVGTGRVVECVTPAMLARFQDRPLSEPCAALRATARDWPCMAALLSVAPQLDALDLDWGPTGSAGFWLATGLPVLRPTSDLDLVVRAPTRPGDAVLAVLAALQKTAACQLDIQVDTGSGGFALAELMKGAERVMLKTASGPVLTADPWAVLATA